MLAAGEDPGEAGLMGPKWFPSATPPPRQRTGTVSLLHGSPLPALRRHVFGYQVDPVGGDRRTVN